MYYHSFNPALVNNELYIHPVASLGGGGGGGGGKTGGSIVQYTEPSAALNAGLYGANAADAAAYYSKTSMQDAINSINQQYAQARYDVQPYRTTGVQALNQLNQYMGLDAYNPGTAPTKPTAQKTTQPEIMQYIQGHLNPVTGQYSGVGADSIFSQQGYRDPNTGQALGNNVITAQNTELVQKQVQNFLNQQYDKANQVNMSAYDQNLAEYNQNKAWYDQYSAQGPLTSQQITDKITNAPGYQAQLNQGVQAIGANASARGYLGSGRMLKELGDYGQNTMSQFYGNELSRLAGLVGQGQQAASQTAQGSMNQGNSLASLYQSLGDSQANAQLSKGNSLAQALIAANQQFKVMGQQDIPDSGGGGLGGLGSLLSGAASLAGAFL